MAMIHDSNDPEGVSDDGSAALAHGPSDDLERARERKGLATAEFYIRTRSWERAAEFGGYPSARAAKVAAERAMEREFKESTRSQDWMRRWQVKHLEMMMGDLASKAADKNSPEQISAIKTINELLRGQAKLLGLDAPQKLSLIDPTQEQIEAFLNEKIGPRHSDTEADIFEDAEDIYDAEIIEDDPEEPAPPALEA